MVYVRDERRADSLALPLALEDEDLALPLALEADLEALDLALDADLDFPLDAILVTRDVCR